jgi:hypothetical protein
VDTTEIEDREVKGEGTRELNFTNNFIVRFLLTVRAGTHCQN